MQDFIYRFDLEDPRTAELNKNMNDEEYITRYLKIRAKDGGEALAWGRVLADWLVMHLFGDSQPGRWSRTIAVDELWEALPRYRPPLLDHIWASAAIPAGAYPDLDDLLRLLNLRR